jgi:hypothetical protein
MLRYLEGEGIVFLEDGGIRLQRPMSTNAIHNEATA